MGIKTGIAALLAVSIFLVYLAPKPGIGRDEEKLLYAEPLFMRGVCNISHTLVGDILWLKASGVGELSGQELSVDESVAIARTVTVMDPFFFPAVHYFATYLAGVKDTAWEGARLYQMARWFAPDDFRLIFNEMILRVTYEEPLDNERVIALARQAVKLPQKIRYIGTVDLTEMVEGIMLYAASREQLEAKKREDLLWLLEHSSPKRHEEIEKALGFRE